MLFYLELTQNVGRPLECDEKVIVIVGWCLLGSVPIA